MQTVCLIGKPNVGKSTIFNRLIKEKKSIIMDTPGVTRDRIYGVVHLMDKSFHLIDTGGLSLENGDFNKDILAQATLAIDEADLILFIVDATCEISTEDKMVASMLHKSNKKVLVLVNKADNKERQNNLYNFYELGFEDMIAISAEHNIGFDKLNSYLESNISEGKEKEDNRVKFCFVGRPNVGKSSLVNALLKEDRLIVSDIAGTTRDAVDSTFKYNGGEWKDEEHLPAQIQPLYGVVLEDQIRRNAKETLEFFHRQGVDVKVISGDHVKTVAMIAKRAGLRGWADAIDMSSVGEEPDYDAICREYTVFARVTPKQKQELVKAFQRQGHKVAMTGDGVNDLLALREADCSIAIADGSDASRQIAQVVLMDSDFTHLPQVVMEGRKVIHNVTRTAGVFFIKTIYSVLVSIFCVLTNTPFPFIPIQITLIDACIEAYPSFLTILESDTRRIKGRFLSTAIWNAAPFGIVAAVMIGVTTLFLPMASGEKQTIMYLTLIIISMTAVIRSCIPFNVLRGFICVTMICGTFGALVILPGLFEISAMSVAMWGHFLIGSLTSVAGLLIILNLRGQQEEYKAHMRKKKIKREA